MRIFELDIYKYRDFGKTDVVKRIYILNRLKWRPFHWILQLC